MAAAPAYALDPREALTQFGLDLWQRRQGLPQSTVTAMAQTREGYIWLGTEEGLARFDGVRFTVFDRKNTPQLPRHNVTCLLAARDGGLWIGTLGGGLVRYENGRFQAFTEADGLPEDIVSALMEDRDGLLWIGTFSKGVARLRRGSFERLTTADGLSSDEVRALDQDRDGSIWIGTRGGGVDRYENGHFTVWTSKQGLVNDQVTAIVTTGSGEVWIGTRGGLNRMSAGSIEIVMPKGGFVGDTITTLATDRDGSLWVGTAAGGLYRYAGGRFDVIAKTNGLASDAVRSLLEDRDGGLWIGASGGLNRLRPGRFLPTGTPEGLSEDDVRPVMEDRAGNMWIGTLGGGLNRIRDGQVTVFRTKDGLLSDRIWSLHEDPSGVLWVGTREGLNRYEKGRWTSYTTKDGLSNNLVLAIASDALGALWIGTAGGLDRFSDGRFTRWGRAEGLSNERVCAIAPAPDGSLWIGTMGGGVNLLVGGRIERLPQGQLASSFVKVIYPDSDGSVWVGTGGDGLFRFKGGRWNTFTSADGLFDDVVYSILEDGRGNLWTSSNRGISRVARADLERFAAGTLERIPSVAYDTFDGLREAECNGSFQPAGWRSRDGRLWFSTVKGAASVDPARLSASAPPPPVFVEEVIADETTLLADRFVRLPPGRDRIEFHYTALSFPAPEKLRFRFKLEGYDREWVEAGARRTATYTNLPPGSYRFHVQAVNGDGAKNEAGASFAFALRPHFYRSPWFLGLAGVALAAAAVWAHRFRLRAAVLEADLAAARLQALRAQLQPHFLFNTLNMILPLIYRDPKSAVRALVQLGELLRQSLDRDATKLVALSDEIAFLQKYLDIQRVRFQSRFTTEISVDEDVQDAAIPSLLLQPLVENAITHGISKHRGAGSIEIEGRRQDDRLFVRIRNTSGSEAGGPSGHSRGIGLSNIEERLKLFYGGRYRFTRGAVPGGFEVVVEVPLTLLPRPAEEAPASTLPTANARESA